MTFQVKQVPFEFVNQTWPAVEPFLARSVVYSEGELTLDETKYHVVNGEWLLYVITDEANTVHGAVTICFFNRMDNRVAHVTNIGGRFLTSQKLFAQLSELLTAFGATCIEGNTRDSVFRLLSRLGARKKSIAFIIPLQPN